ncbi:uroporphyrinogen-III synthase [Facilibium subflavum]|uniref:uroporphyrinogen-III synthase n=1 Tax=Facilibium subflavum TaxID=2219058 RepID=UPI0013C2CF28|nr:uroporphyrinogen-III synthase [Facilibium subflavum]
MQTSAPEVIVCRPQPKGEALVDDLLACGIQSVCVPTLLIAPKPYFLDTLQGFSDVIFISHNAVHHFFKTNPEYSTAIQPLRVWCVGSGTHKALHDYGINAVYPQKPGSEGLLAEIEQSSNLQDRHFLLVKGEAGRDLIDQHLSQVAGSIRTVECYQRTYMAEDKLKQSIKDAGCIIPPKLMIFTSFDGLKAAMPLFDEYPEWKYKAAITVTNCRMFNWAKAQGFVKLYIIDQFNNDALVEFSCTFLQKGS